MQTDLKEEGHEKTNIKCIHGAGAVPDAAARPRMGGGSGRAGGRCARRRRTACGSVGACAPGGGAGGGSPGGERRGTGGECELRQHYGRLCRSEEERRHADPAGGLQNTEYERTIRYFRQLHAGFEQLHADGTAVSERNQYVLDRQGFRHRRKNPSYRQLVATVGQRRNCHHRERHPCHTERERAGIGFW